MHTGLERRAAERHTTEITACAGLGLEAVGWHRKRDVAVFAGDCVDRLHPGKRQRTHSAKARACSGSRACTAGGVGFPS
ncbi:hypothetical protein [Pseudonocardia charpentierae]|uniref:Uncharacterized protein n=1 Tax=Pseudonocardia charpentierae TaxID=3075545 RepID=A0ABU2NFU8_9PSEU|nr:hypothetical protein [Pseudonocardia sp. DSM 45834]MDT0352835.1 hypothetical protein [Pseudonocardia sp. DSM 45834]